MKIDLRDVTLCAVDCVTPELAVRAIEKSLTGCRFGRVLLLTDCLAAPSMSHERVQIEPLRSIHDYSRFMLKGLGAHIHTEFVLIIQWDGFVVDPTSWTDGFRQFDYIGARWDWYSDPYKVGNGGFSWRSRRLLQATAAPTFEVHPDLAEDLQICRLRRDQLTASHGIRFADDQTAGRFSYERSIPDQPTFGFHGLFNLWRHASDAEIHWMMERMQPHAFKSREFIELMLTYWLQRRFPMVRSLLGRALSIRSAESVAQHIDQLTRKPEIARALLSLDQGLEAPVDST